MLIMIVEDEPVLRGLIEETIRKRGFQTLLVERFDEVIELFVRHRPHLVMMDIQLPVRDGFYWCKHIRELSEVPVLFLSSRTSPIDTVTAIHMGGDDFIQKPVDPEVLLAKINALLRRTYSYVNIQAELLEHDGIILDLQGSCLHLQDDGLRPQPGSPRPDRAKIELTKTEFRIAAILMRNKGTVVSRKKMMRLLWEDESFIDDNTLTVNIARLRKKLAELGKPDFITTRKGEGYVIQ